MHCITIILILITRLNIQQYWRSQYPVTWTFNLFHLTNMSVIWIWKIGMEHQTKLFWTPQNCWETMKRAMKSTQKNSKSIAMEDWNMIFSLSLAKSCRYLFLSFLYCFSWAKDCCWLNWSFSTFLLMILSSRIRSSTSFSKNWP